MEVLLVGFQVVMTVVCLLIVDRCGRRCLLLVGTSLMMLGIILLGITTIATPYTVHDPCALPTHLEAPSPALQLSNTTIQSVDWTTSASESITVVTVTTTAFPMTTTLETAATTANDSINSEKSNDNNTQLSKREILLSASSLVLTKRESENTSDSVIGNGTGNDSEHAQTAENGRYFSLLALMMYIAGYAVGFGPGMFFRSLLFRNFKKITIHLK